MYDDTIHLVRFGVGMSLSSLSLIYALAVFILFLFRRNFTPVKIHGFLFICVKTICFVCLLIYVATIVPTPVLGNAVRILYVAY